MELFATIKMGDFELKDKECSRRFQKLKTDVLKENLKENGVQTIQELAEKLEAHYSTIVCYLQALVKIQKLRK